MARQSNAASNRPKMVRGELMGGHTHTALGGVRVHVWRRGDKYLARGRLDGRPFGETIGGDPADATARLRQFLTEIDNGTYVRRSEARQPPLARGTVPRLTLRHLLDLYLSEKRRTRGKQTTGDYQARLMPVLDFAEQTANLRPWRLASDIDREFVVGLRTYLPQTTTTRNGRCGGRPKPRSGRKVVNVLQTLKMALGGAHHLAVRRLSADWIDPLSREFVGTPAEKDSLREDLLPLDTRVRLGGVMDRGQLCQLALSLVLPLRPGEAAGLLVSDVDLAGGWLEFGHRFRLPFPPELVPVLQTCIGGRAEGPLLRSRKAFAQPPAAVSSAAELRQLSERELLRERGAPVGTEHDRKLRLRRLLRDLGGVSEDDLAREFKDVLVTAGATNGAILYTLRGSVTTAMNDAHVPHLEMRYLTSHSTSDILNEYATLSPAAAMARYFESLRPLLDALLERAEALDISTGALAVPEAVSVSWADRITL